MQRERHLLREFNSGRKHFRGRCAAGPDHALVSAIPMSCNATRTWCVSFGAVDARHPFPRIVFDTERERGMRRTRPTRSLRHSFRHDASATRLSHRQCRFAPQRPWRNVRRGCNVIVPACSRHTPVAAVSRGDQMVPFGVFVMATKRMSIQ